MAYTRYGYSTLLDKILSEKPALGQGCRWETSPAMAYRSMIVLWGAMRSFIAQELKESVPAQARDILATASGRAGRYRGEEMRHKAEAQGLPLDIPQMWAGWDLPNFESDEGGHENEVMTNYYHAFELSHCPFQDVFDRVHPAVLRATACEVMHEAAFKGFNPAMEFWLPSLMPRGEGKCTFRLRIPPDEAEKVERRAKPGFVRPTVVNDDGPTSYRKMVRGTVIFYHFFTDALLSAVGPDETRSIMARAMAKLGAWRGREMQDAHLAKGLPLNLKSFITYLDEPAAGREWIAEDCTLSETEHRVVITKSAWSELFVEMGTGPLSALFFEEALPAQARAYNPLITMTIPRLKERGDAVTEFHYTLAG